MRLGSPRGPQIRLPIGRCQASIPTQLEKK
jgi:hypothetical protein